MEDKWEDIGVPASMSVIFRNGSVETVSVGDIDIWKRGIGVLGCGIEDMLDEVMDTAAENLMYRMGVRQVT